MITQAEKFQAIERIFPNIPHRVKSQVASRIVTLDNDNVKALILAHVRHTMTAYNQSVKGCFYNNQRADQREYAMIRVYEITSSWK
jgi:hypothetical protein